MKENAFQVCRPNVEGNPSLRVPQREAYSELLAFAAGNTSEREVGLVLPVGCGKSGCIALAPFAMSSRRTLVVAPGLNIADQLHKDFDPASPGYFYKKCNVLKGSLLPEPVEIRGKKSNRADLDEADVVVTNIQQLQGTANKWLQSLPSDFFDLILFDEGHHSVAETWQVLKESFPEASIVNFSATPLRADGQRMAGRIIYSYPVAEAIKEGYVKRLKAVVLNPKTLKYVRLRDNKEVEVSLNEVRRLGEEDADFRRSIVTSSETLNTIVDASIRELQRIREDSGDQRHKIIAAALNYQHCTQVVEAYRAKGYRVDYVHSREDTAANAKVIEKLKNHELDVVVQVRKLGEGFDHPYLSVAAVFSVFANLSPFVQFVGRIMRVVRQNEPDHPSNRGTVVFHAGANIARRWDDFQEYSEADQEYFDELLPMEGLDFTNASELAVTPGSGVPVPNEIDVRQQSDVELEEIPLLKDDPELAQAMALLRARGISGAEYERAVLEPLPTSKVARRQASRAALEMRVRHEVARVLHARGVNPAGYDLDTKRLRRTNYVVLKSAIDKQINGKAQKKSGERHELTAAELKEIESKFPELVVRAEKEVFDGGS